MGERRDGMSDLIVKAAVKDALSDHNVSADFYLYFRGLASAVVFRGEDSSDGMKAC